MIVRRYLGAVITVFSGVSWNFNALGGVMICPDVRSYVTHRSHTTHIFTAFVKFLLNSKAI